MNDTLLTILKVLASLGTASLCVSPIPSMLRIYKSGDTGELQLLPLVGMFVNYNIATLYGLFKNDIFPLAITMLFGQIMAVVYVLVFSLVTADRIGAIKLCSLGAVPVVLTTVYAVLAWAGVTGQTTHAAANVLGYTSVVASLCFFSSPFATIRNVMRSRNAASIPIAMCTAGTIANALWTLYGLIVSDWFVCLVNLACVLIGATQILLYIKYSPNKKTPESDVVGSSRTSKQNQQIGSISPSFHMLRSPLVSSVHDPEHHV